MDTAEPSFSLARTSSAAGDEQHDAEFRDLFLAYYERILSMLQRLTGNRSDAEDLANEVFLRLSRLGPGWWLRESIANQSVANNVGGWLYRTATHAGIDFLRSRKRRSEREQMAAREIPSQSDHARTGPLVNAIQAEEAERVRAALSAMKPARAQLLLMRASDEGYAEIAAALGVSIGSVGTLLNRAEAEFRKRYVSVTARKEMR